MPVYHLSQRDLSQRKVLNSQMELIKRVENCICEANKTKLFTHIYKWISKVADVIIFRFNCPVMRRCFSQVFKMEEWPFERVVKITKIFKEEITHD